MKPPTQPTKEDCCNSGCNPCIFDVFDKQLKLYEEYQQGDNSYDVTDYGISQLEYKVFYLLDVLQISGTHKILFFQKSKHDQCPKVWWRPGDHFLIKYTSADNVSCTRAYTPIKLQEQGEHAKECDFFIAVKRYTNGLVSNYLFNLTIGQETLWRGPYGSYNMQPDKFNRIIMIAQGTGVAPFMSIIQSILSNEEENTRMVLCYCCKDITEILFRYELYEFNSYWNFRYKIYLSIAPDESFLRSMKYNEPVMNNKFTISELDSLKPHPNDQYLLCGSEQFMKEFEVKLKNGNYSENIVLF